SVGDLGGAEIYVRKALSVDPDSPRANEFLVEVLVAKGNGDEAIAHLTARVKKEPNRADALSLLAAILNQMNRFSEAEERVAEALAISPELPFAHAVLGHIRAKEGKTAEAIECYERALKTQPSLFEELTPLLGKMRTRLVPEAPPGQR